MRDPMGASFVGREMTGLQIWATDGGYIPKWRSDEVALMQFTGLCDKNGREIYEGDIMEGRVDGELRRWAVEWNKYVGGFVLKHYAPFSYLHMDLYEVVGNVWENPELLEREDVK